MEVTVIVQQVNPEGTRSFSTIKDINLYNGGLPSSFCSTLTELKFSASFGNWTELTQLTQNSLTWDMDIDSAFDATISLLAFPHGDSATFNEKVALTLKYGETTTSTSSATTFDDDSSIRVLNDIKSRGRAC
jgi:hypothetical protein